MLRVLSLFAGIGGFDLGLERTGGFKTVAFCEIEPFCQRVLARHWPEVPCYDDVRTLTAERLATDGIVPNVIVGGFPCQDISTAGRGAGLAGERSGLWFDYARLVGEIRPDYVIVENVGALLSRGLDAVLGTLAALGYDAEWHCIPASYLGAHHRRDRLWIVAYAASDRRAERGAGNQGRNTGSQGEKPVRIESGRDSAGAGAWPLADTQCERQPGPGQSIFALCPKTRSYRQAVDAVAGGIGQVWRVEPNVGRVADGVPQRVDRLKSLGNAVVPQIPELIGNAILASLAEQRAAA
jgi:DNA (cytosine-5)-methyltransferase 1